MLGDVPPGENAVRLNISIITIIGLGAEFCFLEDPLLWINAEKNNSKLLEKGILYYLSAVF